MEISGQKQALSVLQIPLVEGHHSENLMQGTKTLCKISLLVFSSEDTLYIYVFMYVCVCKRIYIHKLDPCSWDG